MLVTHDMQRDSARRGKRKSPMRREVHNSRSGIAAIVFNALDPVPYGFFLAALIFDVVYERSADVLWVKSAAWLITIGLLFAVLPRLINLVQVWRPGGGPRRGFELAGFWMNVGAIAAAIVNAFVHSRDAFAAMPDGLWLSCLTMALLVIANVTMTLHQSRESSPA